jgi:Serine carboxypeptidase S28
VCTCMRCSSPVLECLNIALTPRHANFIMLLQQGAVQYNRERADQLNVTDVCSILTDDSSSSVQLSSALVTQLSQTTSDILSSDTAAAAAYAQLVSLNSAFRAAASETCLETSWSDMIGELKNATFNGESAARQWQYQTCNEFGWFQTASSGNQPFFAFRDTLNTASFLRLCREAYDIDVVPQTAFVNAVYGGLDISSHRTAYPSGSLDPWSAIALVEQKGKTVGSGEGSLYIDSTAHCADMHSGADTLQTPELTAARRTVASLVDSWVITEDQCASSSSARSRSSGVSTGGAWALAVACLTAGAGIALLVAHLIIQRRHKRETEMTRGRTMREPLLGAL